MGVQQSLGNFGSSLSSSLGCRRRVGQRPSSSSASSCSQLDKLGDELLLNISNNLSARSIGCLGSACQALAKAASDEAAWHEALRAAGGGSSTLPRSALRAIVTLKCARWKQLEIQADAPPARDHHVAFAANGGTMILFGGLFRGRSRRSMNRLMLSDCWALDVASGRWTEAATTSRNRPAPRTFTADGGGGGVLQDSSGQQWMVIYGGLRSEGYRDNETWALGPLQGGAERAATWQWHEIQSGGGAQSPERPRTRFHHTQTVLGASTLAVVGGHDFSLTPILHAGLLSLHESQQDVAASDDFSESSQDFIAGLRWQCLPNSGCPTTRAHHSACADRGKLILFGGQRQAYYQSRLQDLLKDTWVLDPTALRWRQIPVEFPEGRAHAACTVANESTLLVSGGSRRRTRGLAVNDGIELCNDVWMLDLWDPSACGWACLNNISRPFCLTAQANVLHSGATLIVFGGHDNTATDHFGDPAGGFKGFAETLALRFDGDGLVKNMRLCDAGWVDSILDVSWTLVPFQELGLAVACGEDPNLRMAATVLRFDNLHADETEHPAIRATRRRQSEEHNDILEQDVEGSDDEEGEESGDGDDGEDDEEQQSDGGDEDEVYVGHERD